MDVGEVKGAIVIDDRFTAAFTAFQTGVSTIVKSVSDLVAKLDALHTPQERTKTDAEKTAEAQRKAASETDKATEAYRKLAAALDPVAAGTKKYQDAHLTLTNALSRGVISISQYETSLEGAKEKFLSAGGGLTQFQSLLGKLTELTGLAGPAAKEAAEGIGALGGKAAGVSELVGSLGPLAPILLGVAAAVAVVAIAWKAFELAFDFLKEAIIEGAEFEQTVAKLNNTLIANGSASGLSAREMIEFAESLSVATARPTAEIVKGLAVLSQFQKVGHDTFQRATKDILDYAQQTGTAPEEAFQKFGRALEGGQRGLRALEEVGGVFLKSQKANLQVMLENGEITKYQTTLLAILEEHVKGAAAAYEKTFNGQVAQAKNTLIDFKEAIASEVLPALEDVISAAVSVEGGWKNLRSEAKELGHQVGDAIRIMVYGIGISYFEIEKSTYELDATLIKVYGAITVRLMQFQELYYELLSHIPTAAGDAYGKASAAMSKAVTLTGPVFEKAAAIAEKMAKRQDQAIATLELQLLAHRKALEGDDEVQKKHGSTIDDVAKKIKDQSSALEAAARALQQYSDKIDDTNRKQSQQLAAFDYLSEALKGGLLEYNQAVIAQQRSAAITQALTDIYKAHRTEVENLTAELKKLEDNKQGGSDAADKIRADIEKETKAYADQATQIGIDAGKIFDRKSIVNLAVESDKEEDALFGQLASSLALLSDAQANNTDASRAETAAQADESDKLKGLSQDVRGFLTQLRAWNNDTKSQTIAQNALNTALDNTANVKAGIADWNQYRDAANQYGKEVADILNSYGLLSDATQRQAIEEKVLAAIRAGATPQAAAQLRNDLTAQQQIVNGLKAEQAQIDINEKHFKAFADALAQNFSGIFDNFLKTGHIKLADFENAVQDAFASTVTDIIKNWLTQWFEAMAEWLARWIATQAAASAAQAALGLSSSSSSSGGVSAGSLFSLGSSAYGAYGAYAAGGYSPAGGVLAGWSGGVGPGSGGAYTAGSGGSAATGGSSALGSFALWLGIIAAASIFVDKLNSHFQKTEESIISLGKTLNVNLDEKGQGQHVAGLVAAGEALANQIKQFFSGYDGVFSSLDSSIAVKKRGRGGNTEWKVYVDGIMLNFGKDMDAALNYALIESIKHSSSIGLDPLAQAAIKDYVGGDAQQFKSQIDFAERIATQNLPQLGGQIKAALAQYLSDLQQAQTVFAGDIAALATATASINQKLTDTVKGLKNNVLGIDTSASDFLAGIVAFQNQMKNVGDVLRQQIQQNIDSTEQQIKDMGNGPKTYAGEGTDERAAAKKEWDDQIALLKQKEKEYTDQLAAIPNALTKQEVGMAVFQTLFGFIKDNAELAKKYGADALKFAKMKVDIEFGEIKLQLIALGMWDQYAQLWTDAYNNAIKDAGTTIANLSKPPRTGSSGTSPADQRVTLRAQIAGMQAEAAGALHKTFYDLQTQIADFAKQAKAAKLPAAELAAAIALMTRKFKDATLAQAQGLAGIGTDFTSRLKGAVDFFHELEDLGRVKTGIPNWLESILKGDALGKFGNELNSALDAFRGLINPMDAINTQADTLRQNVIAYGKAAGWTADQIQTALDRIQAGVDFQKQSAINGIMDQLFQYLQNDAAYTQDGVALKKKEVDLQFTLWEAQLKFMGVWDDWTEHIFNAAKIAADKAAGNPNNNGTGPNPANALADAANQLQSAASSQQSAADAFRQAISKLTDYENSLLTNPSLSPLTPSQQRDEALRQLRADYSSAAGGNVDAVNAFQGLANTFLQLDRSLSPSNSTYSIDFQSVLSMLDSLRGLTPTGLPSIPPIGTTYTSGSTGTGANGSLGSPGTVASSSSTPYTINLDPVVSSISSASVRNHNDLSDIAARVTSMTSALQSQQAALDRLASYAGHSL